MKFAYTTNELNTLRNRPQSAKWYIAVHRPRTLATMTLAETPTGFPVSSIKVAQTGAGETLGDVIEGTTLWLGTGADLDDVGRIRVRRDLDIATSRIPIAEAGSGLVDWNDVTRITCKEEFYPWAKHPRYDADASKWNIDWDEVHGAQLVNRWGPYVNIGPPVVGVLDKDTGAFSASFFGASTLFWNEPINTDSTVWTFPDGQTVSSALGTSNNPIIMTFTEASPSGSYMSLSVTDAAGASHIGRRLIFLYNDASECPRVTFAQINGGYNEGGYKTTVTALTGGSKENFPKGAEVVIWESASYGDTASSIGSSNFPYRANVVMRGWITEEATRVNPFTSDTTFTVHTIDGILRETHSRDVFLWKYDTGTSGWIEASPVTLDRMAFHILKNRSTISNIVDFYPASGFAITEELAGQDLPKSNLWQQLTLNYNKKGFLGRMSADLQSNLHAFEDVQITGNSGLLPTVMEITDADRRDQIQISSPHLEKNSQVFLGAVIDGDTGSPTPVFAESPGTTPGYWGGKKEVTKGLVCDTQDTLITWSGNLRAKINSEYSKVVVPLSGNTRLDPVPQSLVSFSLSGVDNARGISWSNKLFIPNKLTLEYDGIAGYVKPQIEMEEVVQGIGGSAFTPPRVIVPAPPPDPAPNPDPPTPGTPNAADTVYICTDDTLAKTTNFTEPSPTWTKLVTGALGTPHGDFILDPWSPTTTGYLTTSNGVYKSTNLDSASPTFAQVLSKASIEAGHGTSNFKNPYKIMGSINQQNYVIVFYDFGTPPTSTKFGCAVSENGGTTWTFHDIHTTLLSEFKGGADIVPHVINGSLMLYAINTDDSSLWLYKSTDKGKTWSAPIDISTSQVLTLHRSLIVHCPYNNNSNGNIVYMGWDNWDEPGSVGPTILTTDGGTTFTDIDSGKESESKRHGIETYTQNRQRVFHWRDDNTLWLSTDAGTTFTQVAATGISGNVRASGGFPYNQSRYYVLTTAGVFYSEDGGLTFTDKTGDLSSFVFSGMSVGEGVIVPLWVS